MNEKALLEVEKLAGDTGSKPDFVDAAVPILSASNPSEVGTALLHSLHGSGLQANAVGWSVSGKIWFEPPDAASPEYERAAAAALAGRSQDTSKAAVVHLLGNGTSEPVAVLLAPPGRLAKLELSHTRLLTLAGLRLSELVTIGHLRASVNDLAQAERLQHALFAIADMAASDRDMQSMLYGMHQIIGQLMYAENFCISLYNRESETLRLLYYADEMDDQEYHSGQEIPADQLSNSLTLGLIHHGQAVRGPSSEIAKLLRLPYNETLGTPSTDYMGVPMLRDGQVVGTLAVQSYRESLGYTASDCAVLGFVAEHVLNAVERKRGQKELEQHIADRTRELAHANAKLQAQVVEREHAAHLQATLYQIAALANNQESDADFYHNIHQAVGELINAENFYIALCSKDGTHLDFPHFVDSAGETYPSRPMGRGLSEYVIRRGETVLVDKAGTHDLITRSEIDPHLQSHQSVRWLGAPLQGAQGVMGVVVVQSYRPELVYDDDDADLLTFVSHQIASSVQRRQQGEALHTLNVELEQRVHERTRELRQEISVRKKVETQLKHQVMHDPLTGLPNRLYLRDRLDRAFASYQRNPQRGFALLYLDIDRFKLFNDNLGHLAGDAILREVASRMLECVRSPDTVARLSGDEFAILLGDNAQSDAASRIAQRIQNRLRAPIQLNDQTLQTSVSTGISVSNTRYRSTDEMLHDADRALYRAKANGRQQYVLFDKVAEEPGKNVLELEQELRSALHTDQLRPYFQPITQLEDGGIVGYEALIRWQHPTRGLLTPADFLPIAEQSGLIEAIDWHMYRLACQASIPLLHNGGFLTLNISPRHFQHDDFDQRLLALLKETDFDPVRLRIEVTESTLLSSPETTARILQRLHNAHVGAALDGFGSGQSSLSHVHHFPLKMIKIDRSFIAKLDQEDSYRSAAIIEAVLRLARSLNLGAVAEGVETESQRQALLAMGCTHAQGYLFGRPAPASHWIKTV